MSAPFSARTASSHPVLLVVAALLATAPIASVARAEESAVPASAGPWLPLETGREWTYVYARERQEIGTGVASQRDRFRGTLHDVVKGPAPEFGEAAVEVVSELRGTREGSSSESVETRRAFLERVGTGYRIHAIDTENPLGGTELSRYDPPLRQLATGPGAPTHWVIGTVDVGGIRTRLDAEVVGLQDVETPSGSYEDCLVIRYQGRLRGTISLFGADLEVTDGMVAATEWFARGVGLVLAKEEVEQALRLPDGSTIEVREKTQYSLSSHGIAAVSPEPKEPDAAAAPASR